MRSFLSRLGRSPWFSHAAKLGLTLGTFTYVFLTIDLSHMLEIYEQQDHAILLLALIFIVFQLVLGGVRWKLILQALAAGDKNIIGVAQTTRYFYVSSFFNCCLPGTVGGDVVRTWLVRSDRVPLQMAIYSVVIDRLLSLFALVVLVLLTLPLLADMAGFEQMPVWLAVAGLAACGLAALIFFDRITHRFRHVRAVQILTYFIDCMKLLWKHKTTSVLSCLMGVLAHVCFSLSGWLIAQSLGIEMSILQALTLLPPVLLATTLPISVGGWGVREASAVGILALIGVPSAAALLLSVQLGLLNMIFCLPGGIVWLFSRKQVRRDA